MKYINFIAKLLSVIFIMIIISELSCFFYGIRLDWRYIITQKYNMMNGYKDLAIRTGWLNHIGTREDLEDKTIQVTCWPNLMRRCRPDPDKSTDLNVAFIDASWTFGTGVTDENTFIYKLNEKYPQVTFDNYGVGGYGPAQSLQLLKHFILKQKKYDLVVYCLYMGTLFTNQEAEIIVGNCQINHEYLLQSTITGSFFSKNGYTYKNPSEQNWPLENRLLLLDIIKRIYCVKNVTDKKDINTAAVDIKKYNLVSLVFDDIQKTCKEYDTDFMICCIDYYSFPYLLNYIKTDCPKINLDFAESCKVEYHVLNNPVFHPNYKVHDYWFRQFSKWFDDSKYMKRSPSPCSSDSQHQ